MFTGQGDGGHWRSVELFVKKLSGGTAPGPGRTGYRELFPCGELLLIIYVYNTAESSTGNV